MSTASKSVEVCRPLEANYNYEPEKKAEANKPSLSVAFPPLPKEINVPVKSKCFKLPKLRFGSSKRKEE
ncbi:hypothetical protein [Erwinia pyrifoliae]|uniref:Uncharacterized protein n=1 Tax=Erwinia pyrifoliae TaxID=79967 RepID=A0ABY5XBN6_ERWPY|nr:hypothetical protein [Erwinia pyrifoliae]UWS31380.1 hypothetical protein NYP81_08065 [Erwinia pyrifoliae]UWS34816.1 hypothetical protein NYP84_06570 [Erwinia pyrifoliae]